MWFKKVQKCVAIIDEEAIKCVPLFRSSKFK